MVSRQGTVGGDERVPRACAASSPRRACSTEPRSCRPLSPRTTEEPGTGGVRWCDVWSPARTGRKKRPGTLEPPERGQHLGVEVVGAWRSSYLEPPLHRQALVPARQVHHGRGVDDQWLRHGPLSFADGERGAAASWVTNERMKRRDVVEPIVGASSCESALRSASWVSEETFRPADLASAARSSGR